MSSRFVIRLVRNDDLPLINIQLIDHTTGNPIDVSADSTVVTGKFRKENGTTIIDTITATKTSGSYAGVVYLQFTSGALDDLAAGTYEMEISVSFNGSVQTCLDKIKFPLIKDF